MSVFHGVPGVPCAKWNAFTGMPYFETRANLMTLDIAVLVRILRIAVLFKSLGSCNFRKKT